MKKYFEEGLGAHWNRKAYPPLRTFREFCEEFNVKEGVLRWRLSEEGAPKPVFTRRNTSQKNSWYNIKEMRAWWTTQPESKKVAA